MLNNFRTIINADRLGIVLGSLWGHFRYTKVALGRSWSTFGALGRHFGDTLASLLAYECLFGPFRSHFEVALGSVRFHFGVTFGV